MCSIFGILDIKQDSKALRGLALAQSQTMRHRGPDWSGIWMDDKAILVHERLAIVDVESGEQPLLSDDQRHVLLVNGEIYNHQALKSAQFSDYSFATESDCEVILPLLAQPGLSQQEITERLNQLEGMFAFILYDSEQKSFVVARDPIGIIPLYYGYDQQHQLWVSSELKALSQQCEEIHSFPPGHFYDSTSGEFIRYYNPQWREFENVAKAEASPVAIPVSIRDALEASVKKHLMSDVPYAVLLSGGLDSSVISAIVQKFAAKRVEDDQQSPAWWPQLHSFAVGLKGAPDLVAAKQVADAIGTIHHTIHFTPEQGVDAISEVIYHLETYDVTTIRAATPMYLMARKIKSMGIKMVLSGEGSDEIFGGYLYFHKAPDSEQFHQETVRKLDRLHHFDCLRANKAMAAWGVEARVPFLDRLFLDAAMSINPKVKMCVDEAGQPRMEKHILREAFEGYLPKEILWRQKEQFSDGVGYSWIDSIREYADKKISDREMARAAIDFPINTPDSKEALLFRKIFASHFPGNAEASTVMGGKSIACSTVEALAWDESFTKSADPSGRAMKNVHRQSWDSEEDKNCESAA